MEGLYSPAHTPHLACRGKFSLLIVMIIYNYGDLIIILIIR